MKDNQELSMKLSQRGAAMTPLALQGQLEGWFRNALPGLRDMASEEEARKVFACAKTVLSRNPKLLTCSKASIQNCILNSLALGLYPGAMGEVHYVPYGNEATFIPDYKGLVKLAMQSGFVRDITAEVVYEADTFDFQLGDDPYLRHKPYLGPRKNRGERVCVYALANMKGGRRKFEILTMDKVDSIKSRSRGADSKYSPWANGNADDYDWMCKKTAIKQLLKPMPKSTKLAEALELDNAVERPDLVKPVVVDMGEDQSSPGLEDEVPSQTAAVEDPNPTS